ncbi:MAG: hypothetical protein GY838_14855, partial [bacterium]|nr:hypothetical protein [bacterium]
GNLKTEEYFGGDVQTLSTSADLCGLSLPANQYEIEHSYQYGSLQATQYVGDHGVPLPFKAVDLTIDKSTGLVASSRDSAGIETAYGYTSMNRLRWVRPEDDSWTEYVHTRATSAASPAKVTIIQRPNGSTTGVLAQSEVILDPFGRTWKQRRWMPGLGWSTRETRYNAMGWKSKVSEYSTGAPAHWTTLSDYDAFGRPGTVTS